jgi:hypothetical protein
MLMLVIYYYFVGDLIQINDRPAERDTLRSRRIVGGRRSGITKPGRMVSRVRRGRAHWAPPGSFEARGISWTQSWRAGEARSGGRGRAVKDEIGWVDQRFPQKGILSY